MMRFATQLLAGWGNYPVQRCRVFRPEKTRDLKEILVKGHQRDYISRGLGRSYGDAALNLESGVILHERLNRLMTFAPQTGVLECEAGVTFAEIIDCFLPRGYFLPVTPGTKYITVGGAIAGDVHGKNHHRVGSFAEFLLDFQLLTATGEVLTCSKELNPDAFWATVGGMGLTGIILSARMRLMPIESAYITVNYQKAGNLDQALEQFDENDDSYEYSTAWIDCLAPGRSLGRSVLMRGNHTPATEMPDALRGSPSVVKAKRKIAVPFYLPGFVLNPLSMKAFNTVYYHGHRNRTGVIVDYYSFFYPLDSVLHWNRMYGKRGFVQYQAVFPPKTSRQGLTELLEKVTRSRRSSFLAVLKRFGPGSQGLISFPHRGYTLALDLPNSGSDLLPFLRELDEIVLKHDGRVYLAKDTSLTPDALSTMYPNLSRFKEIKGRLDPDRRFASSLAKRLGMVDVG